MTRTAAPRRIDYLVYLCGIQVPATAVTVTFSMWDLPTAVVSLPPDNLLDRLGAEDLLPVTIFYLDTHSRAADGFPPAWCLLMDGVLTGVQYASSTTSASVQLTISDIAITLQMLRVFWLMSQSNIVQAFSNNDGNQVWGAHGEFIFPASLFYQGVDPSGDMIRRPFDFVENMFRSLVGATDSIQALNQLYSRWVDQQGGDAVDRLEEAVANAHALEQAKADAQLDVPASTRAFDSDTGKVAGVDIYRAAEDVRDSNGVLKSAAAMHWWAPFARRRAFLERWVPCPGVEDSYNTEELRNAFPVLAAAQGEQAVNALKQLANTVGDGATLWDLLRLVFQRLHYEILCIPSPAAARVTRDTRQITGAIGEKTGDPALIQYVTKPQTLFALAPACNVMWPSLVESITYAENYLQQPSRVLLSDGNLFNVMGAPQGSQDFQELANAALATAWPPAAQEMLDRRLGRNGKPADPLANPHNYVVWAEEFFRGPVPFQAPIPSWFIYLQNAGGAAMSPQTADRLNRWRADAVQYLARAGIRAEGPAAAEIEQLRSSIAGLPLTAAESDGSVSDERIALSWLQVTALLAGGGPVEPMPGASEVLEAVRADLDSVVRGSDTRTLYAAQLYYQQRYQARTGSLRCRFHPYVCPGFPGVFFDRPRAHRHFHGVVVNVTHTLTNSSASTQISFSYGRTGAEFVEGVLTQGKEVAAAPAEPIPSIRDRFQRESGAQDVYTKLFHRNAAGDRRVVGNVFSLLQGRPAPRTALDGEPDWTELTALPPRALEAGEVEYRFKPQHEQESTDSEAAHRWSSRPVCTLAEWIALHDGYGVEELVVEAGTDGGRKTLRYPARILRLQPGPGVEPPRSSLGTLLGLNGADTRRDWQSRLLEYRDRFYRTHTARPM